VGPSRHLFPQTHPGSNRARARVWPSPGQRRVTLSQEWCRGFARSWGNHLRRVSVSSSPSPPCAVACAAECCCPSLSAVRLTICGPDRT
jgi:hypothetical protein